MLIAIDEINLPFLLCQRRPETVLNGTSSQNFHQGKVAQMHHCCQILRTDHHWGTHSSLFPVHNLVLFISKEPVGSIIFRKIIGRLFHQELNPQKENLFRCLKAATWHIKAFRWLWRPCSLVLYTTIGFIPFVFIVSSRKFKFLLFKKNNGLSIAVHNL